MKRDTDAEGERNKEGKGRKENNECKKEKGDLMKEMKKK